MIEALLGSKQARGGLRALLPHRLSRWISRQRLLSCRPPVGWVRWGSLARTTPISPVWGHDRGRPIDRYYIERFLSAHAGEVRGRVLEVGDDRYTRQFGDCRVTQADILHVVPGNARATFVGDIAQADHLPGDAFDCLLFTQVLQYVFDVRAALRQIQRILKPGGVLLATVPGIIKVDRDVMGQWPDYWRFTSQSLRRLSEECFGAAVVQVEAFGNIRAAVAALHGLAQEDLGSADLDRCDPHYEVIIGLRAVKGRP
jgi:SAM-dependent methyltransferase